MNSPDSDPSFAQDAAISATLAEMRQQVQRLQERIGALEQLIAQPRDGAPSGAVDERLLATISAALAAYLGVKPHIRQITLLGGATWAQQGRVTIHASHALSVRHDTE